MEVTINGRTETEHQAWARQKAAEFHNRLRQHHERVYPDCHLWLDTPVAVDHGGRKPNTWLWDGCPTHAPSTSNGIPSERMVQHARLVMLATLVNR